MGRLAPAEHAGRRGQGHPFAWNGFRIPLANPVEVAMFAQHNRVECVIIFEPKEGIWHRQDVEEPTRKIDAARQDSDEESFEAFCRRSLT
jgi:hypothetical protein